MFSCHEDRRDTTSPDLNLHDVRHFLSQVLCCVYHTPPNGQGESGRDLIFETRADDSAVWQCHLLARERSRHLSGSAE
jgi:hypothetical protein